MGNACHHSLWITTTTNTQLPVNPQKQSHMSPKILWPSGGKIATHGGNGQGLPPPVVDHHDHQHSATRRGVHTVSGPPVPRLGPALMLPATQMSRSRGRGSSRAYAVLPGSKLQHKGDEGERVKCRLGHHLGEH